MKIVVTIIILTCIGFAASQTCDPRSCVLPDCRCWNDPNVPGDIEIADTPQMVIVTFENALNEEYDDLYSSIFSVDNPNGCPTKGTLFVQDKFTNYDIVRGLYDKGHEIGANSLDGTTPKDDQQWIAVLKELHTKLNNVGVKSKDVVGVRAPDLFMGGTEEYVAIGNEGFLYDASCATSEFMQENNLLWPFTYDVVPDKELKCDIGKTVDMPFPGLWQILLPDLMFNGTKCASPQACTAVVTKRDAFDMFFDSFANHYEGQRSPFFMILNPDWVRNDVKRAGTIEFLEYIRAAFEDTWIVTARQALEWVRDPVPQSNITEFAPWQC